MNSEKHSVGFCARFAHKGKSQLIGVQKAGEFGLEVGLLCRSNHKFSLVGPNLFLPKTWRVLVFRICELRIRTAAC